MTYNKRNYYPYFDYVRFIAASIVMFGHDGLIHWTASGKIAVDVFFALSGWLIGAILIKADRNDLPKFYFNRAVRIWIPYLIALIFIVIASLLKDDITGKWFEFVLYKLTFVYNIFGSPQLAEFSDLMPLDGTGNHFWSVNAEEQFYLLSPILLVIAAKYGKSILLWGILAAVTWYFNLYSPIVLGVLAALLVDKYGDFHRKSEFVILWIVIASISAAGFYYGSDYNVFSPAFAISVVLLLAIQGRVSIIGKFLGGISYPLYLNHWIGVFAANILFEPFGLRDSTYSILAAIIIAYIIASILYQFIDKRCLSMRGEMFTLARGKATIYIAYGTVITGSIIGYLLTSYPN